MRKFISSIFTVSLALLILVGGLLIYDTYLDPSAIALKNETSIKQAEADIFDLVNAERKKNGLEPLIYSDEAAQVAYKKAAQMHDAGYFAHESPITGSLSEQFKVFGGIILGENAVRIGENIAYTSGYQLEKLTGEFWVEQWLNSPPHRANILNANYTHIGIAVFADGHDAYAVQEFLTPS